MKRIYLLVAIGVVELLVGSFMLRGAAEPIHVSEDAIIDAGTNRTRDFSVLGSGRLSGNLHERSDRPFDLLIFDERGYASFLGGSSSVPPLASQSGSNITVDTSLPGSGRYFMVFGDFTGQQTLTVDVELVVTGLKTNDTIFALIVIAGGLALVGASLMMTMSSSHRPPKVTTGSSVAQSVPQDPPDDDTRVY